MLLYHFSNKDFTIIKPDFFGENYFTKNDAKFSCKRFFCYDTKKPKEYYFNTANFRYSIRIKDKDIYNLDNDVLNLKERFFFDIDKILSFCIKKYKGICYTTSFLTYAIFSDCRIFKKENLIYGKAWN